MDDDVITALEEAIADLGTLLVQMDKFRAARAEDARALRAAALAIGDRARRAHRHGRLDAPLAHELAADVAAARAALDAWLTGVRTSPGYRAAAEAMRRGDCERLRTALPALYDGVEAAQPPAALFHSVVWQRRGRPRPAAEIAAELLRQRDEGFPGHGDPDAPGVEPELPGVPLHTAAPPGEPIVLVVRGSARPPWVLALAASGDVVVPGSRAHLAFTVALADPADEELDEWTLDPAAYRRDLALALDAVGLPIDGAPGG